jgi:hypothetical protein
MPVARHEALRTLRKNLVDYSGLVKETITRDDDLISSTGELISESRALLLRVDEQLTRLVALPPDMQEPTKSLPLPILPSRT